MGPADGHDHIALTRAAPSLPLRSTPLKPDYNRPVHPSGKGAGTVTEEQQDVKGLDELRVLLVDDHDLFRSGLRGLLEEQGLNVVGEAENGQKALRLVPELVPDVVIMDLKMPGLTGVEATRKISSMTPLARVVVLTISAEDEDVMNAVMAGACGYLLKDSSIDQLIAGILAAANGESLISPQIASRLLQWFRSRSADADAATRIKAELSERELEVLRLIAMGKDNAQIARDLFISPKTVKNHTSNILMKLQIENRIQAAVYAVRSGLV